MQRQLTRVNYPPATAPSPWISDRWGYFKFRFDVFDANAWLPANPATYLLVDATGTCRYAGKSINPANRLDGDHEALAEARRMGLRHILLHCPTASDPWSIEHVEALMIDCLGPSLNKAHPRLPEPYASWKAMEEARIAAATWNSPLLRFAGYGGRHVGSTPSPSIVDALLQPPPIHPFFQV